MSAIPRPLLLGAGTLSSCTQKATSNDGALTVNASDSAYKVSETKFPAGHITMALEDKGSQVTEVCMLFSDDRIAAERENIGPKTKASLVAELKAGDYEIACKPGLKGDGIRQKVRATRKNTAAKRSPQEDTAVVSYPSDVLTQAEQSPPKAKAFTDAPQAGDIDKAKQLYTPSRIGWERTEPVAEAFGDIDPKVDVREDGLEAGQIPAADWTGWRLLEKFSAPTPIWSTSRPTSKARRRVTSCSSRSP